MANSQRKKESGDESNKHKMEHFSSTKHFTQQFDKQQLFAHDNRLRLIRTLLWKPRSMRSKQQQLHFTNENYFLDFGERASLQYSTMVKQKTATNIKVP